MSSIEDKELNQSRPRTTKARKRIERSLQTAKYFQLIIGEETEDEFEWRTLEERDQKLNNLTKAAIRNFKRTHDEVLAELGLAQVYAFGVDKVAEKRRELGDMEELDMDGMEDMRVDQCQQ